MKKIFMILALAAMTLTAGAQDVKTHEFDKFIAVYPADYKPRIVWGDVDGFDIDENHNYEVVIDPYCATLDGLKARGISRTMP